MYFYTFVKRRGVGSLIFNNFGLQLNLVFLTFAKQNEVKA